MTAGETFSTTTIDCGIFTSLSLLHDIPHFLTNNSREQSVTAQRSFSQPNHPELRKR
jgi:hypothetical protein